MKTIDIKGISTKENYDKDALSTVIAKIYAGETLLFIGAGFSIGSTNANANKSSPPLASDLSKEICIAGGFDIETDLAYSADYFLRYNDPDILVNLLTDNYTITDVCEFHKVISAQNWRRVYTTNYDNCYELASSRENIITFPVTLADSPAKYFRSRNICIHINGSIQSLSDTTLEKSFKLTDSSYTNSDAFSDSSWSYRFKKDLEVCTQIVFIGYSLADMEVKRLLVDSEYIKNKTFFVTKENPSTKEHHRLSQYGEVFPVGVEQFAQILLDGKPDEMPKDVDYYSSLRAIKLAEHTDFNDNDIRDFLLRGKDSIEYHASALTSAGSKYSVARVDVEKAFDILEKENILFIHSALANGKTVFTKQLIAHLILRGEPVFNIFDGEGDYENDIEKLSKINRDIYLCIDNCENHLDIVRYFANSLKEKGKLIITERPHRFRRVWEQLKEWGFSVAHIDLDYLQESEAKELVKTIENAGLSGSFGGKGHAAILRAIKNECESQLSAVLIGILKSPHIFSSFKTAFSEILSHPDTKKAVYSICLIQQIHVSACNKSFISDISDSNHIYTKEFDERVMGLGLFEFRRSKLVTRSAIFGTFILSNLYNPSYSIDQLVRIQKKLKTSGGSSYEEKELYKGIMTFGTLAEILPQENKGNSYIQFYDRLKKELPSVMGNPHYWLQYAMAVMSTNNLHDAERILVTAESKAKNITGYDMAYIENQFARLYLKQSLNENDSVKCFELFIKAHKLLISDIDNIHKFRQAGLYIPFIDNKFNSLQKGNKVKFEHAMNDMVTHFNRFLDNEYVATGIPPFQRDRLEEFEVALASVKKLNRSK